MSGGEGKGRECSSVRRVSLVTVLPLCPAGSLITLVMSEAIHVDLRMLRSFRVLRPLKLVSRVPSECGSLPAPPPSGQRAAAVRQCARAGCTCCMHRRPGASRSRADCTCTCDRASGGAAAGRGVLAPVSDRGLWPPLPGSTMTMFVENRIEVDFRMLRSFRVLRPLKLVSRVPSKSPRSVVGTRIV